MLVPPDNFGLVETGIYRCSKLESDHFPFLETLNLKSLIVLDAEKPPRLLKTFLETNNVDLYNLGGLKISNHHHTGANSSLGNDDDDTEGPLSERRVSSASQNEIELIKLDTNKKKNDHWMLIEKNLILRAFQLLLNKNKHNVLLVDSTSTLVGILRKIQKWNFNSIVNEYRIYSGSASKSNYYAENFLELMQTELIPYEIDQLTSQSKQPSKHSRKHSSSSQLQSLNLNGSPFSGTREGIPVSPSTSTTMSPASESSENSPALRPGYEPTFLDIDDDEDDDELNGQSDTDTDDDLLSASPQIPANLLKLVEKRKQEKQRSDSIDDGKNGFTPGTSPKNIRMSRQTSISSDVLLSAIGRRRSSMDTKHRPIHLNNIKFRSNSISANSPLDTGGSSFPGLKRLSEGRKRSTDHVESRESLSSFELKRVKEKYDYKYYKNLHKFAVKYENVNVIKIKLPPDEKLPSWFIKNRDCWEVNFKKLNNL
ncbi:protein Oca4p [[Candida] anglica]|uniref:Protein Oca4p n=1 Tax=[Candida] anglica TaxID=148631 RepID=A0ABP0EKA2_9ASCO